MPYSALNTLRPPIITLTEPIFPYTKLLRSAGIKGSASGSGLATAEAFAKKGWALVLASRRREDLEIVSAHGRTLDAQVLVVPTDVGDAEAVRALADVARDFTGKVDLWFSNVGVGAVGKFLDVPIETHEQIVRSKDRKSTRLNSSH